MKSKPNSRSMPAPQSPAPSFAPPPGHGPRPSGLHHRIRHLTPDWSDLPANAGTIRALQVCAVAGVGLMLVGHLAQVHDMAILMDLGRVWGVKTDLTCYGSRDGSSPSHRANTAAETARRCAARIQARGFLAFSEVPRTPVHAHLCAQVGGNAQHIAPISTQLPAWRKTFVSLGQRVDQAKALTSPAAKEVLRQAATELRFSTATIATCVRLAHAVAVIENWEVAERESQPDACAMAEAVQYTLRC